MVDLLVQLLTLKEVTATLKVPNTWIYSNIHRQTLPFGYLKVGHLLRFPASEVKMFVESQIKRGSKAK